MSQLRRPRLLATGLALSLSATWLGAAHSQAATEVEAQPTAETQPADAPGDSVDDTATWVNPADPSKSLIIAANHAENTVEVYDLAGHRVQKMDVPANNVDIRHGFMLAGQSVDLVGVARNGYLAVYKVDAASLRLVNVAKGGGPLRTEPSHGFCMYKSAKTGKVYAFPMDRSGYISQYEMYDDAGEVNIRSVRGPFTMFPRPISTGGNDSIEGCATDDGLGYLYVGEQDYSIWRYGAEPTDPVGKDNRALVDSTTAEGGHFDADVEGLTVVAGDGVAGDGGAGYLIASSQGDFTFTVYDRQPPHAFVRKVRVVAAGGELDGCERTDGIDATYANLGPAFPNGLFICQDNQNGPGDGHQNFKLVPLERVVPIDGLGPTGPPGAVEPGTTPTTVAAPPVETPPVTRVRSGYWMLGRDGKVFAFGDAAGKGDPSAALGKGKPALDLEPTPSGEGYWVLDAAGAVHPYGDAASFGGVAPAEHAASLSATPSGNGYWIFTSAGKVFPFGDAKSFGDMAGTKLNQAVLDSVATPTGLGYYLVAADGGIFSFGDAKFLGSTGGLRLNAPVQSLVPDPDGTGYWLVASDGGVFAFAAPFRGSMAGHQLNAPVTGMVAFGNGYLMVGADGGIFNFSDRPFAGSLGGNPPTDPIVAVAARR